MEIEGELEKLRFKLPSSPKLNLKCACRQYGRREI